MKKKPWLTDELKCWLLLPVILLGGFVIYRHQAYRYRHPEMTETQLSFHFWDAMRGDE